MPSATDVYITPASRKIEWYQSSAVKAEISGSSGDLYVSGSGDLQLDAEGNNINLRSAGTKWGAMNNNNAYWDFDGNAGSSYLRFIPWNGGAGTTAYTYWGDATHDQVITIQGAGGGGANETTLANAYFRQKDGAGNTDTYIQAGGDSYILNDLGIGTSSPSGRFNVSGGATTLDNAGNYALYFKNAGTQYGAIDTYGGSLSIEAASEAILSGASGVVLKGPGIFLGPTGTSAGDTQELKFRELAANGTAAISIKAPDSISNENRWILPADIGTANQVLTVASVSSTSMTLDWAAGGGISGLTGLVENNSIWLGADPNSTTNTAERNVSLGTIALDAITTGDDNVAIGYQSLTTLTEGADNVAVGKQAGLAITTGDQNTLMGSEAGESLVGGGYNTVIGSDALKTATAANYAIAIGKNAMNVGLVTSSFAIGMGYEALQNLTSATETIAIGAYAGDEITTGGDNTAVGHKSLSTVSTGGGNTALGREALRDIAANSQYNTGIGSGVFGYGGGTQTANTGVGTWAGYYPTGNYNVFMGFKAGYGNSTTKSAHQNVGIGSEALFSITSGDNNVAVGYQAGYSQTTGDDGEVYIGYKAGRADYGNNRNIAIGSESLISNTTGSNHIAIGYKALESVVDGVHNIAIGREAGKSLTKNQNVAIGTYAMTGAVAQYYNTAVGDGAMRGSTGGDRNTAIGYHAIGNDSAGTGGGHVTAVGFGALRKNSSSALTAIGYESMNVNTSGEENVAVGYQTLVANTTGSYTTAVGYQALKAQTTGNYNTAFGGKALYTNVDGDQNVAIGWMALYDLEPSDGGGSNVAVGTWALQNATTGHTNVGIGTSAGNNLTTGERNVIIGHEAARHADTMNYSTIIGNNAGNSASGTSEVVYIGRNAGYNVSGADNTFVGTSAGIGQAAATHATVGSVAIGKNAMYYNSTTNYCVAVGEAALMGASSDPWMTGDYNTAIGRQALSSTTSGYGNTAVGYIAGGSMTTGRDNVLIGLQAGQYNTTGLENTVVGYLAARNMAGGNYNTFMGWSAGYDNVGNRNTGLGYGSMFEYKQSGDGYNTAIGMYAMHQVETGSSNVAIGYTALRGATGHDMDYNIAIGAQALYSNTSGDNNVAVGRNAMFSNTTASENTALGTEALEANTVGGYNVAVGFKALEANVDGSYNTAVGYEALKTNEADSANDGYNTAIGYAAGKLITTGTFNTLLGGLAGQAITTAERNTILGQGAGNQLTTQSYNTMVGERAGHNTNDGTYNTFVGYLAGYNNAHSSGRNTFIGSNAGQSANSQYQSVFIGQEAGYGSSSSGYANVVVGRQAGYSMTSALANVWIGHTAGYAATTADKSVFIGESAGKAVTTQDASVLIGFEAGRLQEVGSGGNVAIGHQALYSGTQNYQNVALGIDAGRKATGASSNNVYLGSAAGPSSAGAESNKLYINNAEGTPLIGGDFSADTVDIDGDLSTLDSHKLKVVNASSDYWAIYNQANGKMRIDQGTTQRVLASSGEFQFANNVIVDGQIGIGTTSPAYEFDVVGGGRFKETDSHQTLELRGDTGYGASIKYVRNNGSYGFHVGMVENASRLDITANNSSTEKIMSFTSDQKVGIGTSSPSTPLHLYKADGWSGGQNWMQWIQNAEATDDYNYGLKISAGSTANDTAFFVQDHDASNDYFIIRGNGRVGIGTTSPSAKLHLKSSSSNEPTLLMENTNADDSAAFLTFNKNSASPADGDELGYIQFKGDDSAGNSDTFADIYASAVDVTSTTEDASLNFRTMSGGTLTGVMSLGYDGNGFGMNLFTASGAGCTQINYPNVNNAYMMFGSDLTYSSGSNTWRPAGFSTDGNPDPNDSGGSQSLAMQAQSDINITAGYGGKDVGNASADITFKTASGSVQYTPAERMRILGNGNVGIGTSAPAQKLHVEGGFRFRDGNSSSQRLEGYGQNDNFMLVVSGTDALGLCGGTPGVRFTDSAANEHLAIKESGTNHAQFMAGGENLLVMTNDKVIMDQGKGIQHAVGSVTEWLPDAGGSSLEGSITTWDKIQKIRTDDPPINWGAVTAAKLMLPAATAGREHIIVWSENQSNLSGKTFSLNPAAGGDELWKAGVSGPVGINKNTGESIHVICAEAGIWSVVAHT